MGTGFCHSANAQWGDLKGQVLLDGDIPKIELLVKQGNAATKDAAVCAAQDVPDEKLVVNPDNKGIANVRVDVSMATTSASRVDRDTHP